MTALKGILRVGRDVLIIALSTVALGEVGLRIYNSIDPLPIFYSGNPNRFRGKPFAPFWNFHLNSRGFNDVEFSAHKTPGTIRILGIGDSFAFGVVPYEYNYLTLVEQYLKQSGHNVELINMGIPSIGPKSIYPCWSMRDLRSNPTEFSFLFPSAVHFRGEPTKETHQLFVRGILDHVCCGTLEKIRRTNQCRNRHITIMRLHSPTMPI